MSGSFGEPLTASGGESSSGGPGLWVEPGSWAEFTIDAARGVLEAANAHGRELLRLPASVKLPLALDTAMPALRRLREIGAGAAPAAEEQLQLWCAGKLVRVSAKVFKETMRDGRPRLVVRALHDAPRTPDVANDSVVAGHSTSATLAPSAAEAVGGQTDPGAGEDTGPPIPRDDRETLREIARRIREGHKPAHAVTSATPSEHNATPEAAGEANCLKPTDEGQVLHSETTKPETEAEPADFQGAQISPRPPVSAPDPRTLSKIAHELKTPLSAIVAAAEIMRDEQLGPMGNTKYLGYAGDIFESARHALDVINAMLTGSPREARNMMPVDLSDLAVATVSVMQPLARSSGVHLEADCGEECLQVTGDATAIRQIIYNLISNALKFTPRGGEVHVVTGYLPQGVPFFVVRDTGEGMSEDDIVRAFYRDEATVDSRKGGGYGIGLPMVRRLAEIMGATIDVDSEPGKGTVVLVSFPKVV